MPDKKELPPQFDKSALAFIRRNIQTLVHVVNELLGFTHVANDALGLELRDGERARGDPFRTQESRGPAKGDGDWNRTPVEGSTSLYPSGCAQARTGFLESNWERAKVRPEGGKVSIVTRNEASGKLVIEVSDTGIGIPADALSRIFSPFEQGDSSIPRVSAVSVSVFPLRVF